MENMKNVKMPAGPAAGKLARVLFLGGAAVYGLTNCLFNVEGGHRCAIKARTMGQGPAVSLGAGKCGGMQPHRLLRASCQPERCMRGKFVPQRVQMGWPEARQNWIWELLCHPPPPTAAAAAATTPPSALHPLTAHCLLFCFLRSSMQSHCVQPRWGHQGYGV